MKKHFTFVYICRDGENEELRYSLRSIESFYPEADVWVVGGKPDWYDGNYVYVKQSFDKFLNVKTSLRNIVENDLIPDEVIIMNDDFFFTKRVENIKVYISGTLDDRINFNKSNNSSSVYLRKLIQLNRHCRKYRNPALDFDIHTPMKVNKKYLKYILDDEVMWRSNYGNRFVLDKNIRIIKDVKVYANEIHAFKSYDYLSLKYPFFSTHDESFKEAYDLLLKDMFPIPSKHESLKILSSSEHN